jgi:hypothetical protein
MYYCLAPGTLFHQIRANPLTKYSTRLSFPALHALALRALIGAAPRNFFVSFRRLEQGEEPLHHGVKRRNFVFVIIRSHRESICALSSIGETKSAKQARPCSMKNFVKYLVCQRGHWEGKYKDWQIVAKDLTSEQVNNQRLLSATPTETSMSARKQAVGTLP